MADGRLVINIEGQNLNTVGALKAEVKELRKGIDGLVVGSQELAKAQAELAAKSTNLTNVLAAGRSENAKMMNSYFTLGEELRRKATPSVIEFSRVIQDAPYGIMGVGNNIQQLTGNFIQLRQSAGSTGGAISAMLGSMTGPMGILLAVSAVTSLATVFGDKLWGGIFKSKEEMGKLNEQFAELMERQSGGRYRYDKNYSNRLNDLNALKYDKNSRLSAAIAGGKREMVWEDVSELRDPLDPSQGTKTVRREVYKGMTYTQEQRNDIAKLQTEIQDIENKIRDVKKDFDDAQLKDAKYRAEVNKFYKDYLSKGAQPLSSSGADYWNNMFALSPSMKSEFNAMKEGVAFSNLTSGQQRAIQNRQYSDTFNSSSLNRFSFNAGQGDKLLGQDIAKGIIAERERIGQRLGDSIASGFISGVLAGQDILQSLWTSIVSGAVSGVGMAASKGIGSLLDGLMNMILPGSGTAASLAEQALSGRASSSNGIMSGLEAINTSIQSMRLNVDSYGLLMAVNRGRNIQPAYTW